MEKNKYYIGLDGGGTKTNCVITDSNLVPLYECQGGPSNFLILGTETVSKTILNLIRECIGALNISNEDIQAVLLGTTGAGRLADAQRMKDDFISYAASVKIHFKNFLVESDAHVALEGAFRGKPGSILIAGTGSIMFGKDAAGNIHRVGGYGRFIGDEGSGNSLGKMGLTAVARQLDGRGRETLLTKSVDEKFGINDVSKLITEIYSKNFDMAQVAPLVIKAAENGDSICLAILQHNLIELHLHIKAMFKKINEPTLPLVLIGGTITTENYYAKMFNKSIIEKLENVKIEEPELSPSLGAALMAINILNKTEENKTGKPINI